MLNLKLVRKTGGFFAGCLSIIQAGGRMRKKNQQRKLNGQAAGMAEKVGHRTITEDAERTATGCDSWDSQVTFKKSNLVKRWA